MVNVFRLPQAIPAIVEEMLGLGLGRIWVQQGIVNLEAATPGGRGWNPGGDGPLYDGGASNEQAQ